MNASTVSDMVLYCALRKGMMRMAAMRMLHA
jgi:hypothetical protein